MGTPTHSLVGALDRVDSCVGGVFKRRDTHQRLASGDPVARYHSPMLCTAHMRGAVLRTSSGTLAPCTTRQATIQNRELNAFLSLPRWAFPCVGLGRRHGRRQRANINPVAHSHPSLPRPKAIASMPSRAVPILTSWRIRNEGGHWTRWASPCYWYDLYASHSHA